MRFPGEAADRLSDGVYQRLLDDGTRLTLVTIRQTGPVETPVLGVEVAHGPSADGAPVLPDPALRAHLGATLGTEDSLDPFLAAARGDRALAPLLAPLRGLRQARWPSGFETLVTSITAQQVTLVFAYAIRARLVRAFGRTLAHGRDTFTAFPTPEQLAAAAPEGLAVLQYSRRKAEYIIELARAVAEGRLDLAALERLPDDEVVERLVTVRGVGRWTAEWYLIRALGRPDVFPADDVGLQKLVARAAGLRGRIDAARARAIAERWRPYRSTALLYFITAARLGLGPWETR